MQNNRQPKQLSINLQDFYMIFRWFSRYQQNTVWYYHVTYEIQSESTLYSLPECQGTPYSKQAAYLKIKWQQQDSNPQPLSS